MGLICPILNTPLKLDQPLDPIGTLPSLWILHVLPVVTKNIIVISYECTNFRNLLTIFVWQISETFRAYTFLISCRIYLHEYNFKVFGTITTTDVDQHLAMPRCVDDGMIVFLIGEQCDRRTHFHWTTKCKSYCNERSNDVSRSYSR